jgi:hypothetical protein
MPLGNEDDTTVLATARRPAESGGLRIALRNRSVAVEIGGVEAARAPWPSACPLTLEVSDGTLRVGGRAVRLSTGAPGEMPIVTGLFTELDLRTGSPPKMTVTSRDYATSATARQLVAGAAAVILALLALWLMSSARLRRPDQARDRILSALRGRDWVDAAVVSVLVAWWIVAPAHVDDGWVSAINRVFGDFGHVTFYFDHWGVIAPSSYWLTWLNHWVVGSSTDLVFVRLPVLGVLLTTWFVCRRCLSLSLGAKAERRALWVLGASYLVGALAWGMTLRPEAIVALLALVSLWAMLSFAQAPRTASLAVATIAVVLAVAAHPTGVVAFAPLAAAAPTVLRTLRVSKVLAGTILGLALAGLSLIVVLVFFNTDWGHLAADAKIARAGATHNFSVLDEHTRYTGFDQDGAGMPLPRLSLALMILSFVSVLTWVLSRPQRVSVLPAWSVGLGLASLALVPSKWVWHFGALVALTAVAVAAEFERLAEERQSRLGTARRVVALGVVFGMALLAWTAPGFTATAIAFHDLWGYAFNTDIWVIASGLAGAVIAVAISSARRRGEGSQQLARSTAWTLVGFSVLAIAFTIGLHVVDAVRSPWTAARQNLHVLMGVSNCGLADHLDRDAIVQRIADPATATLAHPALGLYVPCGRTPRIENGIVETPSVVMTHWLWDFVDRDNPFAAAEDLYGFRRTLGPQPYEGVGFEVVVPEVPGYVRTAAVAEPQRHGEGGRSGAGLVPQSPMPRLQSRGG